MSSLVTDFLIEPVLRQARRFSSGFAAIEVPAFPPRDEGEGRRFSPVSEVEVGTEEEEEDGHDRSDIFPFEPQTDEEGSAAAPSGMRMAASTSATAVPGEGHFAGRRGLGDDARRVFPAEPATQTQFGREDQDRNVPRQSRGHIAFTGPSTPPEDSTDVTPSIEDDDDDDDIERVAQAMDRSLTQPASARQEEGPLGKLTPLPEDDGMRVLRKRIFSIQSRNIAGKEKAQLMHQLLSEGYTKSQLAATQSNLGPSPSSSPRQPVSLPGSPGSHLTAPAEGHGLSGRLQTLASWYPLSDTPAPLDLPLTEDDLRPTYYAPTRAPRHAVGDLSGDEQDDDMDVDVDEDEARAQHPPLGCAHYQRSVKMQCAACEKWYTCRFCHDEAEAHTLPRKETKNMLCMRCGCAQRVSDTCVKCKDAVARYYCGVCKLWNDDPKKPIYHCNDCGLCRVGQGLGKDFFHCHKCNACLDISISDSHKCIERSTDCDCPICGEYMFSSTRQVVFMVCGHSIHRDCYLQHMQSSYRCPICSKSCVNMETQFRNLDAAIASQPMPEEYSAARAVVTCNDCSARTQTSYHWLGLKCAVCNSYNTVQQRLVDMPSRDAVLRLVNNRRVSEVNGTAPNNTANARLQAQARRSLTQEQALLVQENLRQITGPLLVANPSTIPRADARIRIPAWLRNRLTRQPSPSEAATPRALSDIAAATPPRPGSGSGSGEAVFSEEDEEDEYDDGGELMDFWGFEEILNFTSAESADDDEESDDCDEDENNDDDEDDDEDEEDEISLFGHV